MDSEHQRDLSRLAWLEELFTEWASTRTVTGADIVCRCARGCGNSECAQLVELLRLTVRWPICHGVPMTLELALDDGEDLERVTSKTGRSSDDAVRGLQTLSAVFLSAAALAEGLTWQTFVSVVGEIFKATAVAVTTAPGDPPGSQAGD